MRQSTAGGEVRSLAPFLLLWELSFVLPVGVIVLGELIAARSTPPYSLASAQLREAVMRLLAWRVIAATISVGVLALVQWFAVHRRLPRPTLWAALTALGVIAGNGIASRVAIVVIVASGSQWRPIGFFPLPDLVHYSFASVHGEYAAYLLSTGAILGVIAGAMQVFALPFPWSWRILWIVVCGIGGLAAVSVDAFARSLIFRVVPALALTGIPEPWRALPKLLLWHGAGVFFFGLLTGATMYRMIRGRHRTQVESILGQFD